jgi:hypothetical protein
MYIRANGFILKRIEVVGGIRYLHCNGMHYELKGDVLFYAKGYEKLEIKSQGDNLIDVLKLHEDILIDKRTKQKYVVSIYDNNLIELLPLNDSQSLIVNNIGLETGYKVITHEQYMKLAQEIK